MKEIRKILILELWGIGDVVMMSAVLRPLREKFPQAEICVLVQQHGREILQENREVSRFVVFKFPWTAFRGKYRFWRWDWPGLFRLLASLRQEKFDIILDARGDPRNDVLSFLIGARRIIRLRKGDGLRHRLEHWGQLLQRLGADGRLLRPRIGLSAAERAAAQRFLQSRFAVRPAVLVALHPGAGQRIRCWPLPRFQEVAARLRAAGVGVLVLAEPDGYGSDLALQLGIPYYQGGIRQLVALIAETDFLLCNDTGVMHMACALGIPLVAVFGPGDPSFIGPRENGEVVVKGCPHRPCFDTCRRNSPDCLERITVEDVWGAVLRRLEALKAQR